MYVVSLLALQSGADRSGAFSDSVPSIPHQMVDNIWLQLDDLWFANAAIEDINVSIAYSQVDTLDRLVTIIRGATGICDAVIALTGLQYALWTVES